MWVKVTQLVPNNVLLSDVIAKSGRPIIPANTVLTETHIKVLENFSIEQVQVSPQLSDGKQFMPKEELEKVVQTIPSKTENVSELSFIEHYEVVVSNYKEIFQQVQSGLALDMPKVRAFFIPLLNRIDEIKDELYELHKRSTIEDYIYHHAVAVGLLSAYIAKQLQVNTGEQIQIGLAGLLSDIGMAKLNPAILSSNRPLMFQEQEDIEQHPTYSYRLVEQISTLTTQAKLAILQHHERNDRSGYPLGLSKDKIHPYAHIIAVSDTFHAMTCEKIYRGRQSIFIAFEEIVKHKATKFDEKIVDVFLKAISPLQLNTIVQLSNGKVGKVTFIHPDQPVRPIIQIGENEFFILERHPDVYIKKIIKKEDEQ